MESTFKTYVIIAAISIGLLFVGVQDSSGEAQIVDIFLESQLVPSPVKVSVLLPPGYSNNPNPFPL